MTYRYIILEKKDTIATLSLNRPDRLNAIGMDMVAEIGTALREVDGDEQVRVLILTGVGRAFCSGGDFKGGEGTPAFIAAQKHPDSVFYSQRVYKDVSAVILGLQGLKVPTIAMVNGIAAGAGFSMVQACDMRVGSDQARFMVAWTRRGLVPAFGDTWMLPRIVGMTRATELIFTARIVEAQEALSIGLLNKLVPREQLLPETMALADQIAKGPPLALRLSKYNLYEGTKMDLESAIRLLATCQGQLFQTEDFHESAKAFQEKREPVFKGK